MQEEQYMRRAIELARKGSGHVNPNPLVGAVSGMVRLSVRAIMNVMDSFTRREMPLPTQRPEAIR